MTCQGYSCILKGRPSHTAYAYKQLNDFAYKQNLNKKGLRHSESTASPDIGAAWARAIA